MKLLLSALAASAFFLSGCTALGLDSEGTPEASRASGEPVAATGSRLRHVDTGAKVTEPTEIDRVDMMRAPQVNPKGG